MSGSEQDDNRRHFTRVPVEVEVDLFNENTFFTGFTENLSEGGLFVATEAPFEPGTRLQMKLSLMGAEARIHQVVVRWIRPPGTPGGLPAGMGVQFENLADDAHDELQNFVDQRVKDTLFFDLD